MKLWLLIVVGCGLALAIHWADSTIRARRRGRHARAIPKPHLAWPKGNHIRFTDTEEEAAA